MSYSLSKPVDLSHKFIIRSNQFASRHLIINMSSNVSKTVSSSTNTERYRLLAILVIVIIGVALTGTVLLLGPKSELFESKNHGVIEGSIRGSEIGHRVLHMSCEDFTVDKPLCCSKNKDWCRIQCRLDLDSNGCLMRCLSERDCDSNSSGVTCEDFGTFSAGPQSKCGSDSQGGSQCKDKCCGAQQGYCHGVFVCGWSESCRESCLKERGC